MAERKWCRLRFQERWLCGMKRFMKRFVVSALILACSGCAIHAVVDAQLGHTRAPSADLKTVERLVCKGDIVGAEGLLNARGYDVASMIEAIERAKIKCEETK